MNKEQEIEEFMPYENEDNELLLQIFRSLLITKMEKKLKLLNIETATSEMDYCQILGYTSCLRDCIEIIKNT